MKQLLKKAKIYDGTGAEPFAGDVLIDGDRIARIGAGLTDIIVDQIIAVLQVLALGYTVCRYQNVNVYRVFLHEDIPVLGNGREAGQYIIEARPQSFCRRFPIWSAII